MKRLLRAVVLLMLFCGDAWGADCPVSADLLGARYEITVSRGGIQSISPLTIWRDGDRVAHTRSSANLTDLWERTKAGGLRFVRHFDGEKRAIEFEADTRPGRTLDPRSEWAFRRTGVSADLIENMDTRDRPRAGRCGEVRLMAGPGGKSGPRQSLDWSPALELAEHYLEETRDGRIEWRLVELIVSAEAVHTTFAELDAYPAVDYADIGDHESDPFLRSMIHIGFLEHGVSAFGRDPVRSGSDDHPESR